MKQFKDLTINDFERVPRSNINEVTFAKSHRHTHFKLKSCTIPLNDGVHNSRPLSEVL